MSFVRRAAAGVGVNFHSVERVDENRNPDDGDAAIALACACFEQLMRRVIDAEERRIRTEKKDFLLFECGGSLI